MVADGGVPAVARAAHVRGDALALEEYLDRPRRQAHLDRRPGMAIRHGVEVLFHLDMVVEADLAAAPLGQHVRLRRQLLEQRRVEFLEQLAAGPAETAHDPVVEPRHQIGDGGIEFAQAMPDPMAQAAQQPALDDADAGLDLGFVAGPIWPRRQHRRAVMGGELGVGSIDLRVVEARLDDRDLGIVGHQQPGHAAEEIERAHMRVGPVRQRLGPARPGERQAGGAEHGDEEMGVADLAGQPVYHHRHRVAGIVDECPVAAEMGLAHRHRQPRFPRPVQRAEPAVAIAVGLQLDIFVP